MGILDYSTTPSSNTEIGGIGIQGTNNVQNFDNAFRQLMADIASGVTRKVSKATNYTAVKTDNNQLIEFTAAATLSLTAAATLGDGWGCIVRANGGAVTIDPNSSETINGAATLSLRDGDSAIVYCDGSTFFAQVTLKDTLSYSSQTLTSAQKKQVQENVGGGFLTGLRNCLINSLFEWNQRDVSGTVSLSAGAYGHDRWKAGASGCTYTFSTTAGITTITITSGSLQQVVEAGCFAGRAGDYYLSWSGTAQGRINGGSYGASGAVSASLSGAANATVEFNTGTLLLPQLQFDYVSEFGTRHPQQELAICQWYFRYLDAVASKGAYNDASVRQYFSENLCNPPMRSAPSFSSSSNMVYTMALDRTAVGSGNLNTTLISPHTSLGISGSNACISWAYTGTSDVYGGVSLGVELDSEL